MTVVDPRLAQIPRELQDTFDKRVYFEELERFLHDLWIRTGGGNDDIADESIKELYPWIPSKPEEQVSEMNMFPRPADPAKFGVLEVVSTSADYTTTGNQIIICTNTSDITITLNATPEDTEQVHIVRQNAGGVTISGTINGQSSLVIGQRYSSPHLIYTIDGGEWSII